VSDVTRRATLARQTDPEPVDGPASANRGVPTPVFVLARAGLGLVIVLSFWTSFTAQADVVARSGVAQTQAWVWPVVLDGQTVLGTVTALVVRRVGAARRYAWALVWVSAILSITGNVLENVMPTGPMPMPVRVVIACIPPAALLADTHLLLMLTRHRAKVAHHAAHIPATETLAHVVVDEIAPAEPVLVEVAAAEVRPARVTETIVGPVDAPRGAPVIDPEVFADWLDRWRTARGLDELGRDASGQVQDPPRSAIAAEFGCSPSTAGRALARHRATETAVEVTA
jgi:Protein of unknown function (DUF2637)